MAHLNTTATAVKPTPIARTVRLLREVHPTHPGKIMVRQVTKRGLVETVYEITMQDCDMSGGSAYQLDKVNEVGEVVERHNVLTCGEMSVCSCKDFQINGHRINAQTGRKQLCKHCNSLIVLKNLCKIPC